MVDLLTAHWLSDFAGWKISEPTVAYPFADLVATRRNGEVWLVAMAKDQPNADNLAQALGRLVLMMHRDVKLTSFAYPIVDPNLDPPIIWYTLAVPDEESWLELVRQIPARVRSLLFLTFALVRNDQVSLCSPNAPV